MLGRTMLAGGAAGLMLLSTACAQGGATAKLTTYSTSQSSKAVSIDKKALLAPGKKYFGVFVQGAPDSLTGITDKSNSTSVVSEAGKQPNLVLFYQDWGTSAASGKSNFDSKGAANACAAGMIPMMTWESWNTKDTDPNQGVAYSQPAFSDYNIIHGKYDAYIKAVALAVKKINCPVAIRFDQEQNGYWYPWGVRNTDETGNSAPTPARYKAMWHHVWNIFHAQGATNALWVWSPNHQTAVPASAPNVLSKSYPGNKYVDWVAIDGYFFNNAKQTFAKLFDPTISQLRPYANSKPFLIAETAVGGNSLTPAQKASEITNLLGAIVKRKSFNGFIYFNQNQDTVAKDETLSADWRFDENPQSQAAFKAGIGNSAFAAGKPGSFKKK
jgi:hypothetical protein